MLWDCRTDNDMDDDDNENKSELAQASFMQHIFPQLTSVTEL